MNEYFALDPRAPKSARDIAELHRLFSVGTGRFLYSIPDSWREELVTNIRAISDLCGSRAEEFLRRTFILSWATRKRSFKWDEIALELINDTKLILGERDVKPHIRSLDSALSDISIWIDVSEGHIRRNAYSYAVVAEPIFRCSPKVSIVDPYFRLRYKSRNTNSFTRSKRHTETLAQFITLAAKHKKVKVLCLFINREHALLDDLDGHRFQADLCEIKNTILGAESLIIEYQELAKESSFDSHPRYLLGHNAGLKFDWGFESLPEGSGTQHIAWIGRNALEPLLDRFL
jgi:hypothetical protein